MIDDRLSLAVQHMYRKEFDECIALFEECLADGDAEAAEMLGRVYSKEFSETPDREKSLEYFEMGIRMGSIRSLYYAGVVYLERRDLERAMPLLLEAADNQIMLAQATLGFLYRQGPVFLRDRAKAKSFLRITAGRGHFESIDALCNIFRFQGSFFEKLSIPVWVFVKMPAVMLRYLTIPRQFGCACGSFGIRK